MRFKLDENFDVRLIPMFLEGGHAVETVLSEGLSGSSDEIVYQKCLAEQRALVTMDMDFANPFRFPPSPTEGIIVIRPRRFTLPLIRAILEAAMPKLKSLPAKGELWIVEPGRIRAYTPGDGDEPAGRSAE